MDFKKNTILKKNSRLMKTGFFQAKSLPNPSLTYSLN
jgi:hypothetical protein